MSLSASFFRNDRGSLHRRFRCASVVMPVAALALLGACDSNSESTTMPVTQVRAAIAMDDSGGPRTAGFFSLVVPERFEEARRNLTVSELENDQLVREVLLTGSPGACETFGTVSQADPFELALDQTEIDRLASFSDTGESIGIVVRWSAETVDDKTMLAAAVYRFKVSLDDQGVVLLVDRNDAAPEQAGLEVMGEELPELTSDCHEAVGVASLDEDGRLYRIDADGDGASSLWEMNSGLGIASALSETVPAAEGLVDQDITAIVEVLDATPPTPTTTWGRQLPLSLEPDPADDSRAPLGLRFAVLDDSLLVEVPLGSDTLSDVDSLGLTGSVSADGTSPGTGIGGCDSFPAISESSVDSDELVSGLFVEGDAFVLRCVITDFSATTATVAISIEARPTSPPPGTSALVWATTSKLLVYRPTADDPA